MNPEELLAAYLKRLELQEHDLMRNVRQLELEQRKAGKTEARELRKGLARMRAFLERLAKRRKTILHAMISLENQKETGYVAKVHRKGLQQAMRLARTWEKRQRR
jgi:hypothetical protein